MSVSIAELSLAPGKSMRAQEQVDSLIFDDSGMFGDREYMWVEAAPHTNVTYKSNGKEAVVGQFLSQREDPILTSIIPEPEEGGLRLHSDRADTEIFVPRALEQPESQTPVSVWGWQGVGVDQGDEVAAWGEEHIGRPVRLVRISEEFPRYVEGNPELGRVGFADSFPLLVSSLASIAELNGYLASRGDPVIPTNRIRANILLDGVDAFAEDYIDTIKVVATSGLSIVLKRAKACSRCPIPDTDQVTGDRKTYVRSALGKIGRKGIHKAVDKYGDKSEIFIGQQYIVERVESSGLAIEAGQEVGVIFSETTNWSQI